MNENFYLIYTKEEGLKTLPSFYNEDSVLFDTVKVKLFRKMFNIREYEVSVPQVSSVSVYTSSPEIWEDSLAEAFVNAQADLREEILENLNGVKVEWR
ncbi:MAG: hypothetical protein ACRCZ9_05995 [Fusobacteriaceae bacterium]